MMKAYNNRPKRASKLLIAAVAAASAAWMTRPASAADYSWNTATNNQNWSVLGNWLAGGSPAVSLPGASDNIVTPTQYGIVYAAPATITVHDWTYNSASNWELIGFSNPAANHDWTISGTLSKSGSGTLTLRGSQATTLTVNQLSMSGGILNMGLGGKMLNSLSIGSANISGGQVNVIVDTSANNQAGTVTAAITGTLTMSGSSTLYVRRDAVGEYGNLAVGALASTATTPVIRANAYGGNPTYGTLIVKSPVNQTASFAGQLQASAAGYLSLVHDGPGTQVLTGNSNTYRGGTSVKQGTLLLNNTSGSGTGVGAVAVHSGGVLGGSGSIAPTTVGTYVVNPGITIAGKVSPGASAGVIGNLTINLGGTAGTLAMQSGGSFLMDLAAVGGATINAPGISDRLLLTGMSAGDVIFNGNVVAPAGGGIGWYKLLDTDAGSATWSGLTLSGQQITAGLTLGGGYGGTLWMGDGTNGDVGDIYLNLTSVPEPASMSLLAIGGLALLRRRRGASA